MQRLGPSFESDSNGCAHAELILLAGAQADVFELYARLEASSASVADRFYDRLNEDLTQVAQFPESAPAFHGQIRRLIMRSFPFGIFFTIEETKILIQAILDLRSNRDRIRERLRS